MTEQTLTRPVQDYVPPAPRAPQAERRQPTRVRPDRLRYLWLAAGTALSLLAMGGRWDIPLAGWLFPILLLMFARGSARTFAGVAWVWLASTVATMFWIAESGLPLLGVPALGGIGLSTLLTVPFLLDRVIATRLATRHPLL